jgi:CubicO group peptidase (beta-lactamase class C family)
VALGIAHLSPGLLSAQSLTTALTTQRTTDGKESGVGIGWRIARDSSGRTYYHHAGASNPGGRGVLVVFPREQIVVAMLANILANFDDKDAVTLGSLWMQVP